MLGMLIMQFLGGAAVILKDYWLQLLIVGICHQLYRRTVRYLNSPIRKQGVPGPFLAAFSCWYRAYYANVRRNWHAKLIELHEEYGTIVWISPEEVSVSDPKLRGVLYSFADERKEQSFFPKSSWFETGTFNEDYNIIFETDPTRARLGKTVMSHPYSEKGLSMLENQFDQAVLDFNQGFKDHAVANKSPRRFGEWTHFFMFDLATRLLAGYSRGLCHAGKDAAGAIDAINVILNVVGFLVPIPFALTVTTKSIRKFILNGKLEELYRWSLCYSRDGSEKIDRINALCDKLPNSIISKYRDGEKRIRQLFPLGNWSEAITNNVFFIYAGATVASNALPLIIKNIYSNPRVLAKVREEIADVPRDSMVTIEDTTARVVNGQCRYPYLEATVLEGLRLAPMFGLSLSRKVPSIGCRLNEFYIPPGYVVSMSAWSSNINRGYFGEDAREFRPERWLGNHPTELAKDGSGLPRTMRNYMEAGWFTFGAGARVCLGRHMTELAFAKFIASFVREFDIEIVKGGYVVYGLVQRYEEMVVAAKVRDENATTIKA